WPEEPRKMRGLSIRSASRSRSPMTLMITKSTAESKCPARDHRIQRQADQGLDCRCAGRGGSTRAAAHRSYEAADPWFNVMAYTPPPRERVQRRTRRGPERPEIRRLKTREIEKTRPGTCACHPPG